MSEADSLRLVAEVVDNFSTPLKNLRAQLQDMGKDGGSHTEAVVKGFSKVEGAAKSAGQTVTTVMNPALAAVGITGLGVVAAMNGVGAAMRSLGGSVSALAMLGRETGISAENLRVMQSVMSKFGIEAESSAGSIKTFTQNMREARDGLGPIMQFLRTQGKTTEGRAYFNGLADSLKNSKDNSEALIKALEGLEHIQDPAGRMKYAQEIFGNADIGRLGDQHLGRLRDIVEQQRKLLGPLDPATVKAAEDFEKAMAGLRGTMQKLGTAIATEAMPYVSEFVTGLKSLADGGRSDITGPLRESVREIGKALREIDWKTAGDGAKEFVKGATDGIKGILDAVHSVAAAIRALNEGKIAEAFRHLDGGSGPLARKLAPLPGDDKIERDEKAGGIRSEIDRTREQGDLQRDLLKEAEANGDKGKAAQMRGALDLNSRRMKELEEALQKLTDGTASAQKMSLEGAGTGFGSLIHKASFGGGAGFGGGGGTGRGMDALGDPHVRQRFEAFLRNRGVVGAMGQVGRSLGGYPEDSRDQTRESFRQYLMRKVPGYDGGPMVPGIRPGGPGDRVGRWQRGEAQPGAGGALTAKYPDGLAGGIKQSAKDLGVSAEDLATVISYETAGSFDPWKRGPTTKWGQHRGLIQWGEPQREKYGVTKDMSPGDQMKAVTRYLRDAGVRPGMGIHQIYGAINAGGVSERHLQMRDAAAGGAPGTVREKVDNQMGPHRRKGRALLGADSTEVVDSSGKADAASWDARERARKSLDAPSSNGFAEAVRERQAAADKSRSDLGVSSTMMQRALRAGAGGPVLNADGKVEVHVAKPGPDTKVSTSASGNLFRDVKLNRGKTMAPASQEL